MKSVFAFAVAGMVALALSACGSNHSGSLEVGVGSQALGAPSGSSGQAGTSGQDAPVPSDAHLLISVTEVKAHIVSSGAQGSVDDKEQASEPDDSADEGSDKDAGSAEHGSDDDAAKGQESSKNAGDHSKQGESGSEHGKGGHSGDWVTVFSGHETLDLLDPNVGEKLLGSAPVSSGMLTQLRIIIESATLQTADKTIPLGCPSCSQSGLKLVPDAPITLPAHIVLMFEPGKSLKQNANGYYLEPVIRIAVAP